jgi:hypothetical protein
VLGDHVLVQAQREVPIGTRTRNLCYSFEEFFLSDSLSAFRLETGFEFLLSRLEPVTFGLEFLDSPTGVT